MNTYQVYIYGIGIEEVAFWGKRSEANQQLINWVAAEDSVYIL